LNLSRELKTAFFIIGCILIFIFGFSYLKGSSLLSKEKVVHALYNDVEGLVVGANVTISGMNVGKVRAIDFNENFDKIKVTFSLREDLAFSNQSVAQLYEAGLIGGKAIAILPKYEGKASVVSDNDVLPSDIKPGLTELVNQQIAPLQDKIEGLLTSADSLFAGVSNLMNYETQNNLKSTFEELAATVKNINALSESVNRIIATNERGFNSTLTNLDDVTQNLSQLTDSLNQMPLVSTVKNFEATSAQLKKIIDGLESGEGSAGQLLNDKALYDNLVTSSESLDALLTDLKEHPKRYIHFSIFGRKDKSNQKE
jgi:phospholipid/cholesterol/gamma-HCH transport system substrate-binding protein|tara:strand:- start:2030 stop:2968 length:939 start_codon:yes stop_codon:yes gene_type:complete